jgi:TRAP-type C4-dicarboxylate transport system permease small subunit
MPANDMHNGLPDDTSGAANRLAGRMDRFATGLALLGGGVLITLACVTTLSILGRNLFDASVRGDYEIVEYGAGIAAALFLPLAQRHLVHPRITVFTDGWSPRLVWLLDSAAFMLTAGLSALLSVQLARGAWDALRFNDETMILRLPAWIGIALVSIALLLMALDAARSMWRGAAPRSSGQL